MDLTLARENQAQFKEYLSNHPVANSGVDVSVTVLTSGYWPTYKTSDLNLPVEMVNIRLSSTPFLIDLKFYLKRNIFSYLFFSLSTFQARRVEFFTEYYDNKSQRRRLNWIYSLGNCNILGKFDSKKIEMVMSTYQVLYFIKFLPWID